MITRITRSIDVHGHFLPDFFIEEVKNGFFENISFIEKDDGTEQLMFGTVPHPLAPSFFDLKARTDWMDMNSIGKQFCAVAPRLFFYDMDKNKAAGFTHRCNEFIINHCKDSSGRLFPIGTLPMQDTQLSLKEISFLAKEQVRMVQIGTTINDLNLDDECFIPIFRKIADLNIIVMLHPHIENKDIRTKYYHLGNVVGNPFQTTAACFNMIAGGVFDKVNNLQILVVHGGGFITYQIGRLNHAFEVRTSLFKCKRKPLEYINKNILFDSCLFDKNQIQQLLSVVDRNRVLFGSDYPYDMTDSDSYTKLPSKRIVKAIAYENANRLFR